MTRVSVKAFQGLVLAILLSFVGASLAAASGDPVRVSFLFDGPWSGNEPLRDLTIAEIRTLTDGEFDVEFPRQGYLIGDWTLETAERLLGRLLADPEVDVIVTWAGRWRALLSVVSAWLANFSRNKPLKGRAPNSIR